MNVYVSPISSTVPSTSSTIDRSPSRSGCENAIRIPAIALPIVRCAAKPMIEPDDRGRGEDAAGDRAHLRDDEQRREHADEDDRRHHDAPDDPVARRHLRRQLAPAQRLVDELREDERRRPRRSPRSTDRCQTVHGRVLFGIEELASCEPFFQPVPVCNLLLAEPPAEQHLLAVRARAGKSTRPVSRSLTIAPRSWIAFTQRDDLRRARAVPPPRARRARRESIPPPLPAIVRRAPRARPAAAAARGGARRAPRRAGGSRASSSFASVRREVAWHLAPMIRTSWSPVNDSSSGPRPATRCRRGGRRARRSRSSSGRGSRSGLAALFALLTLEPMRNPKAGPLGRPAADARPRRGHRRVGALGLGALPAHRRARLLDGRGGVLPALPGPRRARRPRARRPLRRSPASSSRCSRRSRRSCFSSASRRNGSAPTAAAGPCSTSRSSRRRSSSRPSTRSRSSSSLSLGRVRARRARAHRLGRRRRRARRADAADRPRARAAADPHRARPLVAARDDAAVPRRVPAASVARRRRPVGVRACRRDVAPAPLGRRPARRRLGRRCAPAWAGVEQLASGSNAHVYWTAVSRRGLGAAPHGGAQPRALRLPRALRRARRRSPGGEFGAPYGLFAALSLALPLSVPSSRWPLLSLPRFGLVVFPFFLALAWLGGRHARAHAAIVGCSAILLGVFVTQWALWNWVA